ncbi:hypothetical protein P879_09189 [Paragonimus westermani]|uniref:Tyrosine-protein phosphatase non-receptor type 9 n=1 Tax=Paragonimus westermani TaxID=34504 RepID=A0A8T0DB03_9TREM|nr:hypothetical protein P879_09189 [Paragonimus westermani]
MSTSFYSKPKEEAASKRRKGSAISDISPCGHMDETSTHPPACPREDHADTPTPPSVVKRLIFPVTFHSDSTDLNRPPGTATMTRPSTVASSLDNDMGFSENPVSPLIVESTTPTADVPHYPAANLRHAGDGSNGCGGDGVTVYAKSDSVNKYRNSAGAESSCSSTTSFFSTGSAGLSSVFSTQSADCSPTGDQLFPRVPVARGGSLSVKQYKLDGTRSVSVMDRSIWSDNNPQIRRIAPLAEDEIGDQTIRHEKQVVNEMMAEDKEFDGLCCASSPPTEASLPDWAVGRPHGQSIHQGVIENLKSSIKDPVHTSVHSVDTTDNAVSPDHKSASCQPNPVPYADEAPLTEGAAVGFDTGTNIMNSTPGEEAVVMDDGYNREEDDCDDDLYEISEESDSEQSICLDDYWMTPTEIATHVETLGLSGVQAEYNAVVRVKSEDSRSAFKHVQNREKNRYCDVFCFEDSRVHLRPLSPQITCSSKKIPKATTSPNAGTLHRTLSAPTAAKDLVQNYIHANWVDGYRQKNAFICTQGPLPETVGDFWQMMWDYCVPVVVMITKIFEADRVKCFPYWPESAQKKLRFACGHPGAIPCQSDANDSLFDTVAVIPNFEVENLDCQVEEHFTCSTLRLTNLQNKQHRLVEHYAYSSWPDHGVPHTTEGLQKLLVTVRTSYMIAIKKLGYTTYMDQEVPPPPVVVHCSAGIGRTGTYVTADICTKWLTDPDRSEDRRINVPLTVSRVRSQRYGCVQVAAQYVFCYRVLLDFAVSIGLLASEQAQAALDALTPSSNCIGGQQSYSSASFYHSSSLPRPHRPFGFPTGDTIGRNRLGHAFAEFRNLLPTSQLLSIWHAMKSGKDKATTGSIAFTDTDFIMTENVCSDSEDNSAPESPQSMHSHVMDSPTKVTPANFVDLTTESSVVDASESLPDCAEDTHIAHLDNSLTSQPEIDIRIAQSS